MIDITSFLLKHLYEFMADNYSNNATQQQQQAHRGRQARPQQASRQQQAHHQPHHHDHNHHHNHHHPHQHEPESDEQVVASSLNSESQQIVAFLINHQLPDLACETLIELIFICVFLAISWILVMIVQLHCHQSSAPPAAHSPAAPSYLYARDYYCNTKFLNSLMYCNNHNSLAVSA